MGVSNSAKFLVHVSFHSDTWGSKGLEDVFEKDREGVQVTIIPQLIYSRLGDSEVDRPSVCSSSGSGHHGSGPGSSPRAKSTPGTQR